MVRHYVIASSACLDFTNTTAWRGAPEPVEKLGTFDDLVEWAVSAGVVLAGTARGLRAAAAEKPDAAQRALRGARKLREAIYRVMVAVVDGKAPAPSDLAHIDQALAHALTGPRLVPAEPHFHLEWKGRSSDDLEFVTDMVARSAAKLLTSDEVARVKYCADDLCGWLFLDTSRNGTRRWCMMADCGNRAKVRRFRERQRSGD
jgi:predicted RNA-binding Zn ribbon-like protein